MRYGRGRVNDPLLRGDLAPEPRTLVDIFRATAAQVPEEPAVEAGNGLLTYAELEEAADGLAAELNAAGVGPGDKVGLRIASGTTDLYVAILGILCAGAAYVPVDADDPEERARLVFGEAQVAAVVTNDLRVTATAGPREAREPEEPSTGDDAWVIFTSGSTGTPKGVAVTHRNAAAFVDAESRLFLQDAPIGVGDRVMAGLSVAFDASCEEIWLAWRYGACLVPAPRALVRSGVDVGPWLVANQITIVSTVPTLVALWPPSSLERVRLLITGGEAIPPELAARLVTPDREVWNTYGPTEATVVACGARLSAEGPVRIGLPLDGWDLAVVDPATGIPVSEGETGELIIGGVGLARYLDAAKDAEKYAPMPTLGWERAYRSGDLVVNDPAGLLFGGRADDQIKLGGRRIELGEIDSALLQLDGVVGAAAAVRKSAAGNSLLVGYVTVDETFDQAASVARLRADMPAALVPRLAVVDSLPTRTSGKVDRDALPWPLASTAGAGEGLSDTEAWLAGLWNDVLGAEVSGPKADFFDLGGGSLTAAQIVSLIRERFPEVALGDVYDRPSLGALAAYVDELGSSAAVSEREVPAVRLETQVAQVVATILLRCLAAPRWLTWIALGTTLAQPWAPWLPSLSWWVLVPAALAFLTPPGRMLLAAGAARLILRGVRPGQHPRGGKVHLRLWLATHAVDELGAHGLAGAPWMLWYARLLGVRMGKNVDLHSLPPVTGMLTLGKGCSIEPEVDLSGHWIEGDVLHLGEVSVGDRARVGARSTLLPGARVGDDAEVGPGSAVFGTVRWASSGRDRRPSAPPARRVGPGSRRRHEPGSGCSSTASPRPCSPCSPRSPSASGVHRSASPWPGGPAPTPTSETLLAWRPVAVVAGFLTPGHPDLGGGAPRRPGDPSRRTSRTQPGRCRGLVDDAGARRGAHLALPALLLDADAAVAAGARRQDRQARRGVDRADDPRADPGQRPELPRRRHPDRWLRARRRLVAGRAGEDRQARLRRQLGHGRARPQGAEGVPGRRAQRRASSQACAEGRELARLAAGAAAPRGRRGRLGTYL
ncbi:putative non-ribosomal peptide synthetase [Nocardioidaceae bacterium Broad-1]|nr:putative non-ribosomal peptide synthetase [Nocardioidaceae bacterium Broad-1]